MLELKNICRYYESGDITTKALDNVNLTFRDSEFVSVLGPSGSGKTTMLNVIGGLDHYTSGDLLINGVSTKDYYGRDWDAYRNNEVGFIFQNYNLIPHQTILSNVELALTLSGISSKERKKRAIEALKKVGLEKHIKKYPTQLSGGQMQRVSIARALVNNPSIIFADEPTGALDTHTSVEIMDLLKELSQNRLVVMVTHNPELAERYSTRIVNLKDGKIISDTMPCNAKDQIIEKHEKPKQKTSMSPITALHLSFSNLLGKKGRTILTAFAGSIGIVGIALILALSNGVNNMITSTTNTDPSELAITISNSKTENTSVLSMKDESVAETGKVEVNPSVTKSLSLSASNDLGSLMKYLEKNPDNLKDNISTYECTYNVEPLIYSSNADETKQMYPDNFLQEINFSKNETAKENMSFKSSVTSNYFKPLPAYMNSVKDKANLLKGRWPEKSNECVVFLDNDNRIDDTLIYLLGFRNSDELTEAMTQYKNSEKVNLPEHYDPITLDQLLNLKFKVINPSSMYEKNDKGGWSYKVSDADFLKARINEGLDLSVVGVADPGSSTFAKSIGFSATLVTDTMIESANADIVKQQLANPDIDVLSGKSFEDLKNKSQSDEVVQATPQVTGLDALVPLINTEISFTEKDVVELISSSLSADAILKITKQIEGCKNLDEDMQKMVAEASTDFVKSKQKDANLYFKKGGAGYKHIEDILKQTGKDLNPVVVEQISEFSTLLCMQVYSQMSIALAEKIAAVTSVVPSTLNNMFTYNLSDENLSKISDGVTGNRSFTRNLNDFGYCDQYNPTSLTIYPTSVEAKNNVKTIINSYNEQMVQINQVDKVIDFKDTLEEMNKTVSNITTGISAALIAFVAISLIVSSIMIGIITYVSVLERRKEIGILRAIGARRKDIFLVFNAETFIVGLVAGVMGILIAMLIGVPANILIKTQVNFEGDIISFSLISCIILIAISCLLTFIAGYIPSRKASRKDPVEAINSQ